MTFDLGIMPMVVWAVVGWLLPAVLGGVLAVRRRRAWALGVVIGAVFSWIGVLVLLFMLRPGYGDDAGSRVS